MLQQLKMLVRTQNKMKKLLAIGLIIASTSAMADGHSYYRGPSHGYWRHEGGGNWGWVAPVIVGGAIGYELARPPIYVQPAPPVVIQQQPTVVQGQVCSPWTQIQNPDGSITTTRTCQ
jgi:hypothetical protein